MFNLTTESSKNSSPIARIAKNRTRADISQPEISHYKTNRYDGSGGENSRIAEIAAPTELIESIFQRIDPLDKLREDPEIQFLVDDYKWLLRLLWGKTAYQKADLCEQYRDVWLFTMSNASIKGHQKQNAGRYAANCWIRSECQ